MELTNEQAEARRRIFAWFREGASEPFVLHGYAGTGKTTLIKHFLAESANPTGIAVLAPTNKAAKVLRAKGVTQAQTIHSFLYGEPVPKPCTCGTETKNHEKKCDALQMVFMPRGWNPLSGIVEETPPTLIIVDECSMVNEKLAADILAKNVPVIAVGDPFQLPPVEGKPGFPKASFQMTHIQRQAADNPIIALATEIRNGGRLRPGRFGESVILSASLGRTEFDTDDWDQVLTWRHTTRCLYNDTFRKILGRTDPLPEVGETVMIRSTVKEAGVANGDMFDVAQITAVEGRSSVDLRLKLNDEGATLGLAAWKLGFGGAKEWRELETMDWKFRRYYAKATFAYAITTHSAQGSEWPNVIIAQDGNRDPKWLYTAITRASEKFMLCMGRDD